MTKLHVAASGKKQGQWVVCSARQQCRNGGAHYTRSELEATVRWAHDNFDDRVSIHNVTPELVAFRDQYEDVDIRKESEQYDEAKFDKAADLKVELWRRSRSGVLRSFENEVAVYGDEGEVAERNADYLATAFFDSSPEHAFDEVVGELDFMHPGKETATDVTRGLFQKFGVAELIPEGKRTDYDRSFLMYQEMFDAAGNYSSHAAYDSSTVQNVVEGKSQEYWLSGSKKESFKIYFKNPFAPVTVVNQNDADDVVARRLEKQLNVIRKKHLERAKASGRGFFTV